MDRPTPIFWDLQSTWTFAAAVMLQPKFVAVVVIIASLGEWPLNKLNSGSKLYAYIYSTSTTLIAALVACQIMTLDLPFGVRLLAAAAAYNFTTLALVAVAAASVNSWRGLKFLCSTKAHLVELATLAIGGSEALMSRAGIPLLWLSLPAVVLFQKTMMRTELQRSTDSIPRPMSEKVWTAVAQEVIKACTTASVLRVDTADPAAASAIARLQAGCDAIGTVGRSGLAILLADCPGPNADSLALRLRAALSTSGISANVAVAAKPRDGQGLDDLLAVSEAELITRDAATRSARSPRPDALS
ncbi:MAG: hypothetical protein ABIP57_21455 [Jatrophihabitantaceae bacterium]